MTHPLRLSAYEGLWTLVKGAAHAYAGLSPKFGDKLRERVDAESEIAAWGRIRNRFPKAVVFACSSAGEYEQAKPLLQRLKDRGDTALFILFFSPSGTRFARSQKEEVPFALVASDSPSYWRRIGTELRPDALVCVRYELWPGMIGVMREFSPLYLIDGVEAPHLRQKRLARKLRASLLSAMKEVFVVSDTDREFYRQVLGVPSESLFVAGDTKYDRVLERIADRADKLSALKRDLQAFLKGRRVIVLGSAWPRDLEEFLAVYPDLKRFDPKIAVILAPHDLSEGHITQIQAALAGLKVQQVSRDGYSTATSEHDVLLVDVLGDLPELYGCGELAWVGGALHFRVHNVLEPACRGLYLCFGPKYETSQEAKVLVEKGLARVIPTGRDFLEWYKTLSFGKSPPYEAMVEAVQRQQGASLRILQRLTATWRHSSESAAGNRPQS